MDVVHKYLENEGYKQTRVFYPNGQIYKIWSIKDHYEGLGKYVKSYSEYSENGDDRKACPQRQ